MSMCHGTEKLITTALIASGELTLAGGKPTVIPRWFSLGYARKEAKEAAVIRQAQTLFHGLSRERDHIDHAQTHLWVVQPGCFWSGASEPRGPGFCRHCRRR